MGDLKVEIGRALMLEAKYDDARDDCVDLYRNKKTTSLLCVEIQF